MYIFVLEEKPTSQRGGQELVLFDICRGLAQRGHKIVLLYSDEENLLEQYQKFCIQTIKVKQFRVYRPSDIIKFLTSILQIKYQITSTAPEYTSESSIVLSNQYQDTFIGRILAFALNIPLVCYLHLPPPQLATWRQKLKLDFKELKHHIAMLNLSTQIKIGLQGVKQYIAVSKQTKADWVQKGYQGDIINVVHNGINLDKYKPTTNFQERKQWNIPDNCRVISYVGRLDKEKGLEILLNAFALLHNLTKTNNNVNQIKLLIAGKPVLLGEEYQTSLEQLSINLGIQDYVSFLGYVSDTTSLYQLSDVTVLPSRWSEPFPRSIIESMACGTPVVASRTGGIPESLTEEFQRGLFEPGNETDLANTLNKIINWRQEDPQLGARCRNHAVSKFSINRMINDIEKILEQFNPIVLIYENQGTSQRTYN
ncbi:MAG: glycosyltransferase family 4 protein [Calothrix sp. FI2-JRJ7]|jgi:glycosyltransferase involved in cell wall biosynthesis|nr:glycosyltransferase family 4 protein [Calothrix sp. FI2-JRJ7]